MLLPPAYTVVVPAIVLLSLVFTMYSRISMNDARFFIGIFAAEIPAKFHE
jgi:hypothetical protein